ncbi:hypothetical protein F66182_7433 [Fusarium sp. NRRL 66182]|nr:hypothetical protein F66182_7433 [Fusarium sp. NRRL 66182]
MHSFVAYTLLASATLSVALSPRFEFPDTVPLLKRQQPGTPQYACHEDCGLLITLGREEGYCDNDEWNERYGRCMDCALTYNVWQYYRSGVTSAADGCGLTPAPSASGSSNGPASTTAQQAASTAAQQPSSTAAEEEPATTADEEPASTQAATTAAEETTADDDTTEATSTSAAAQPEETEDSDDTTAAEPTTLATQPAGTTAAANPTTTEAGSGAGHTSVDQVGTIGITATPAPTPSGVVVSGAAKQFGFSTALVVVALAMVGLY